MRFWPVTPDKWPVTKRTADRHQNLESASLRFDIGDVDEAHD
jgi:hypothetical protein